jgi:trimethylguanosine synthase
MPEKIEKIPFGSGPQVEYRQGLLVRRDEVLFSPNDNSPELRLPRTQSKSVRYASVPKSDWYRRHQLFSKFDDGILMDQEAWYEASPENVARYIAVKMKKKSIIHDGCAGVGGNSIQFALIGCRVFAVYLNASRLDMLRANCKIYGVLDGIKTVKQDVFAYVNDLPPASDNSQALYLSPPWGGRICNKISTLKLADLPIDIKPLIRIALQKLGACVLHLPRRIDLDDVISAFRECGMTYVEIEGIWYSFPEPRLKFFIIYADRSFSPQTSLLTAVSDYRYRHISQFRLCDRINSWYSTSFLKVHYLGCYIVRLLERDRSSIVRRGLIDFKGQRKSVSDLVKLLSV